MSILDQDTIDASGFQKAEDGSLVHGLVNFDHLKWRKRDEEKHGLQDQVKRYMIMIVFKYSPVAAGDCAPEGDENGSGAGKCGPGV